MAADVDDALWQDFHTVVNMTSRELEDWLRVRSADEAGTTWSPRRVTRPGGAG